MRCYQLAMEFLKSGVQTIPLNWYKRPKVAFADIPITREFIEQHAEAYATAKGLGWLCRDYWCIDIDLHTGNGFESLKESPFYYEIVENARRTLIQTTPSGGKHIIFKKHKGLEYSQKIGFLDNVDIKAHDNNFFVTTGLYKSGTYVFNDRPAVQYQGELEQAIFNPPEVRYSMRKVLSDYDFSHLRASGGKGLGKEAYQRIVKGQSINRNQDLYLASSYAKQCGQPLEPLTVLIGHIKNGDVFTEREWLATVNSAKGG